MSRTHEYVRIMLGRQDSPQRPAHLLVLGQPLGREGAHAGARMANSDPAIVRLWRRNSGRYSLSPGNAVIGSEASLGTSRALSALCEEGFPSCASATDPVIIVVILVDIARYGSGSRGGPLQATGTVQRRQRLVGHDALRQALEKGLNADKTRTHLLVIVPHAARMAATPRVQVTLRVPGRLVRELLRNAGGAPPHAALADGVRLYAERAADLPSLACEGCVSKLEHACGVGPETSDSGPTFPAASGALPNLPPLRLRLTTGARRAWCVLFRHYVLG